jgi:hypothetical protein
MVESSGSIEKSSTKIGGSFSSGAEENFRPWLFGAVAKVVWDKPDMAIADIADVSDRAARDYLSGKVAPPAVVIATMFMEITKRK